MLDTYVAGRLVKWAEWSARREDSGLGYPRQCCYTNLMPRTGSSSQTPEFADECFETECCVIALRASDHQLYEVIVLTYKKRLWTVDQKIKSLGCVKDTYYRRIDSAHRLILGYLNDLAAGVALPCIDVKVVNYG